MNQELHDRHCVPCEGNTPPLSHKETINLLQKISGWNIVEDNKKIQKKYHFITFKHAIGFINEVADIAEFEGHHPDIFLHNWNKVTITLYTHAINGLSENDFILASKIDQVIKDQES
jgi:4a-hydroxytetrahydrobiopterin dehydratase